MTGFCFFFYPTMRQSHSVFVDGACWVYFCCRHLPVWDMNVKIFESLRWNACVHRLDLGLYSLPKEFGGMESEAMLTPREKSPLQEKKNLLKGGSNPRRCIKQDSEHSTLPTSHYGPMAILNPHHLYNPSGLKSSCR